MFMLLYVFISFISPTRAMVCRRCNHTHPGGCDKCKKCHPTTANPGNSRQIARAANNPNRVRAVQQSQPRTTWLTRGPNEVPIVPRGHIVKSVHEVTVTAAGKYLSIDFSACFPQLQNQKLNVLSILLRLNSFHSNGWVGLVQGYDASNPRGPDALNRKGFLQDQPRGWQWLAPTNLEYDDFVRSQRLVFEFKTSFVANTKVLSRELYVVVSDLPRVEVPRDLLMVDEDLLEI
nr:coat protein [Green Sichuan pepper ilarvirus]